MQAWESGLYQYLSGEVRLQKGDTFADPTRLNLHANDTLPGIKPQPHGPSMMPLYFFTKRCTHSSCCHRCNLHTFNLLSQPYILTMLRTFAAPHSPALCLTST